MTHIEEETCTKYFVLDEGKVREFDSKEEAEKFKEEWDEFKEAIKEMTRNLFQEWGVGLKLKFEWTK